MYYKMRRNSCKTIQSENFLANYSAILELTASTTFNQGQITWCTLSIL
jgi:hypothetical protein